MNRVALIVCLPLAACAAPPPPSSGAPPPAEVAREAKLLDELAAGIERDLIRLPGPSTPALTGPGVIERLQAAGLDAKLRPPPARAPRELEPRLIPLVAARPGPLVYESLRIDDVGLPDQVLTDVVLHYVHMGGRRGYCGVASGRLLVNMPLTEIRRVERVLDALRSVLREE